MKRKIVISVSGKGGTGKTTLIALLLKWLMANTEEVILVVDADPATNLPDVLGVELLKTVGQVSKEMKDKIERGDISVTTPKSSLLEAWVFQTLVEEDRMEAGLEHLSRRTDRDVDVMLIVTDPSRMGFQTAKRVKELIEEVHIGVTHTFLVGNRFDDDIRDVLDETAKEIDIELAGNLPSDKNVMSFNIAGKSLLELPDDSPAYRAVEEIAEKIGLRKVVLA
jgi:CO dehydrogenase maturation factor